MAWDWTPLHTQAIFSLGVRLLYALFSITGLLGVLLFYTGQLLRGRSQVQKFICISFVNEKSNSLISMFYNHNMRGMKLEEESILVRFYWTTDFSVNFDLYLS